jgi:DNA repair ATPase RecN
MSESKALSTVPEADYEAIEGAVMETARGRWFLAEYARRNRSADTDMLLSAIGRIETLVHQDRETHEMDRLRFDLMEMAKAIARTKSEIASLRPPGSDSSELNVASEALDAIVRTTERATSDILEAAEHVQEAAWTLREEGANEPMCDELDRRATDIYTACSFQDLTAQRTSRIAYRSASRLARRLSSRPCS